MRARGNAASLVADQIVQTSHTGVESGIASKARGSARHALGSIGVVGRGAVDGAGEGGGVVHEGRGGARDTLEGSGEAAGALGLAEQALSLVGEICGIYGLAVGVAVVEVEEVPTYAGGAVGRVHAGLAEGIAGCADQSDYVGKSARGA